MIENFSHVTINCRDLDRSVAFYESIGLQVLKRIGELNSEANARAFRLPAGRLKVVHLGPKEPSENMRIDLVEWLDPQPTGEAYPTLNNIGLARLCFRVSNIQETVNHLKEKGIIFFSEPQLLGQGVTTVCFNDPDGTTLQLIEGLREFVNR